MNVAELIKKLQTFPQNAIVTVTSDNFEQKNAIKELSSVYSFKGEVKEETFRDAFDGESYTSKVVRYLGDQNSSKGITFVKVS
jgi:hypothetical protein